jgi:uncharacterized protein
MPLTAMALLLLMILGLVVGVVSGMLGLGGAVLVIPMLVLVFGFTQQQAIGTSIAMLLPPIGIFAFLQYYRAGYVHIPAAGMLAVGFACGALVGSVLVIRGVVPQTTLRLLFGLFLIYVAVNMILRTDKRAWAAIVATLATIFAVIGYSALRLLGRRMEMKYSLRDRFKSRLEQPLRPDYEI